MQSNKAATSKEVLYQLQPQGKRKIQIWIGYPNILGPMIDPSQNSTKRTKLRKRANRISSLLLFFLGMCTEEH